MKRIQPYYYIVALACVFILGGLLQFTIKFLPASESTAITVDPQTERHGEDLYDLWFSSAEIYDISVDHALNNILFSSDNKVVSLISRDRKLKWEKIFATPPKQAKISSCGNYAAIGTEGGNFHFTSTDLDFYWDDDGSPVDLIALSPNASWIAVARSQPEKDLYHLDFFNHDGVLKWSIETGPVKNLYLTSEYLEQANIYYTSFEEDVPVITAVGLQGEELWSYKGQILAAVSRHGSRLAALEGSEVTVYDSLGYPMWSTNLPFEADKVLFNPQNFNRLLVYGSREGADENLYYYDLAEGLLWMKRIADGSLFSFTADGQHIVTSSWRHYKEDYTQMMLVDRDGLEYSSWEVAMRVEHLIFAGHPYLAVVCDKDGYIDLIDLNPLISAENGNNDTRDTQIYDPVTTGIRAEEINLILYFVDEYNRLIPVTRSVSYTEDIINAALKELVRGPARGSSLYRTIPNKDLVIEAEYDAEENALFIELSPGMAELNGLTQSEIAFNSLMLTISNYVEGEQVYLTMDEEPIDIFGQDLELSQPLKPLEWISPVYVPVLSGDRYYLFVEEGAAESETHDLQHLVKRALHGCRSLPFVPTNIDLIELNITSEQVQLNLNSALRAIFPEDPTERERLQASLVLDALFMTVFENIRTQRAEILIDGEPWATPDGYPSSSRFYRQPNFINPEQ